MVVKEKTLLDCKYASGKDLDGFRFYAGLNRTCHSVSF